MDARNINDRLDEIITATENIRDNSSQILWDHGLNHRRLMEIQRPISPEDRNIIDRADLAILIHDVARRTRYKKITSIISECKLYALSQNPEALREKYGDELARMLQETVDLIGINYFLSTDLGQRLVNFVVTLEQICADRNISKPDKEFIPKIYESINLMLTLTCETDEDIVLLTTKFINPKLEKIYNQCQNMTGISKSIVDAVNAVMNVDIYLNRRATALGKGAAAGVFENIEGLPPLPPEVGASIGERLGPQDSVNLFRTNRSAAATGRAELAREDEMIEREKEEKRNQKPKK